MATVRRVSKEGREYRTMSQGDRVRKQVNLTLSDVARDALDRLGEAHTYGKSGVVEGLIRVAAGLPPEDV